MTRPVPKIGIASESMGDARLVMVLVDRLLIEEIEWIRETFDACRGSLEDGLSTCRSFGGVEGGAFLDLHDAYDLARDRGLRVYGHFNGEPGAADAHMHRAALFLFAEEGEPPKAVVIARDIDDEPERIHGFSQAVDSGEWPFDVIGALARPEIEAWLVAAWAPEDEAERDRHGDVRAEVHFDPCATPENLTSKNESDPKDAKRILDVLTKTGRNAVERWKEVPFEQLESNGSACGLRDFIRDGRKRLVLVVDRG